MIYKKTKKYFPTILLELGETKSTLEWSRLVNHDLQFKKVYIDLMRVKLALLPKEAEASEVGMLS
jgi:hypothetical protein